MSAGWNRRPAPPFPGGAGQGARGALRGAALAALTLAVAPAAAQDAGQDAAQYAGQDAGPSAAPTGPGAYAIEGPGRMSCAALTETAPDAPETRDVALWLTGYLTAHQRLIPDLFDLTPWQAPPILVGLIRQYCAANPDERVETGAAQLVDHLRGGALAAAPEAVAIRHADRVAVLYAPVVAEARRRLALAGFPAGPTTAELSEALLRYQAAQGLERSGLPDQRTLIRLFGG